MAAIENVGFPVREPMLAREAVELERLQMAIDNNMITDEVRANGICAVGMPLLSGPC